MSNKIVCPQCMGTGVKNHEDYLKQKDCDLCGGKGEYSAGFLAKKITANKTKIGGAGI